MTLSSTSSVMSCRRDKERKWGKHKKKRLTKNKNSLARAVSTSWLREINYYRTKDQTKRREKKRKTAQLHPNSSKAASVSWRQACLVWDSSFEPILVFCWPTARTEGTCAAFLHLCTFALLAVGAEYDRYRVAMSFNVHVGSFFKRGDAPRFVSESVPFSFLVEAFRNYLDINYHDSTPLAITTTLL